MTKQILVSRREMLKGAGLGTASILAAPVINRGRFRLFAGSVAEYSSKAVDLIGRTTVIDMLNVLTPDLNRQLRSAYKGSYSFREKIDIEGLNHPKRMFDLTEGLIRRKYSDADMEGILGGNFERVLTQIWT